MSSTAKQTKYIMTSVVSAPADLKVAIHALQESEVNRVASTIDITVAGIKTDLYLPVKNGTEFVEQTLTDFATTNNYSLEKHEGGVKTVLFIEV